MKVRDRTKKVTEYKGRWTDASNVNCPCYACYNVHDCRYKVYTGWIAIMQCATRYNNGCPEHPKIIHLFKRTKRFLNRKRGDIFRCLRCGQKLVMGDIEFTSI